MDYITSQHSNNFEHNYEQLSTRERQVTEKIVQGLPNKRIANELFICERTVKFHCNNIYRKLNIQNRNKLIAQYFQHQYREVQRLES